MKYRFIHLTAVFFSAVICILSTNAWSQITAEEAAIPANATNTDINGSFEFSNLSAGCYNITAYRMILGPCTLWETQRLQFLEMRPM